MAFKSNRELEGTSVGSRIRLLKDTSVLKGMFMAGSILEVIEEPDYRGEFVCRDIESGETIGVHPLFTSYEKV